MSGCRGLAGLDDLEFRAAGADAGDAGAGGEGGAGGAGGAGGSPGSGGAGGVMSGCGLPSGGCPTVLIPDTTVPVDWLAVDEERIYWAHRGALGPMTGSIFRAKKDGSEVTQVAALVGPGGLTVDPINKLLFWTDNQKGGGQVRATSSDGSQMVLTTVVSEGYPFNSLTLGGGTQALFYTIPATGAINRVDSALSPNPPVILYAASAVLETKLVVHGETLYWFEPDHLRRLNDAASGSPQFNSVIQIAGTPSDLDVSNGTIYYTLRSEAGSVMAVDEPTLSVTALAAGEAFPSRILATEGALYWVNDGDIGCAAGKASVRRQSLTVDAVETLAEGLPCPSNFAADALYVYWGAGNQIYRAPKPSP